MMTPLLLSLALHLAPVAPAPLPRQRPPPPAVNVVAGQYTLHWGGCSYQMILSKEGNYDAATGSSLTRWYGIWSWCPKQRVLVINETTCGREWTTYVIPMDREATEELVGATVGPPVVVVRIEKRKNKE